MVSRKIHKVLGVGPVVLCFVAWHCFYSPPLWSSWHRKAVPSGRCREHTPARVSGDCCCCLAIQRTEHLHLLFCHRPASQHPRRLGRGMTRHVMRWKAQSGRRSANPPSPLLAVGNSPLVQHAPPPQAPVGKQNPLHLPHNGQVGDPATHESMHAGALAQL